MSSRVQRLTKSQSMMFSLYSLSGLAFFVLTTFFVLAIYQSLQMLSFVGFFSTFTKVLSSTVLTFVPMLLSLPFVMSITFLVVSHSSSKISKPMKLYMYWVGQAPSLLFGLFFMVAFGAGPLGYVLTATAIVVAQLSRRWVHLAQKVRATDIEAMKALGGNVWQILFYLFIKKNLFKFVAHFWAVYFQIFVLVTPFLLFPVFWKGAPLPALELYSIIGENSEKTIALALLVALAHCLRFIFDHFTSYWEVEYG